jgi:lysophospholipase L1-like esterase
MVVNSTDQILIIGDSTTLGFNNGIPLQHVYGPGIRAAFGSVIAPSIAAPFLPPLRKWPVVIGTDSAAGRSTTNIAVDDATMDALLALYRPATCVIVALGINDADQIRTGPLTGAVFTAQAQRVVNRINAKYGTPYNKIYWIGPWGHDSGDDLVQVADVETRLRALAATWGFQFCQISQTWNSGLSVGDGTHPAQAGAVAIAVPVLAGLSFAA